MKMLILAAGAGSRLRGETGGLPKQLLDVGGRTLLDRLLEVALRLGATPVVVTRPAHAAAFRRQTAVEVLTIEETDQMLASLYQARAAVREDFLWVGGDTVFADAAPLAALLAAHLAERRYGSFLLRRSARHLAKMRPGSPVPRVTLTREGDFPWSLPNFGIQRGDSLADLAVAPLGEYVQRALDRGERIAFAEYAAPLFEIDTPEELAAAHRHFTACSTC
jgi:NDP-sugar pyrophosphorylase family protein